MKDDSQIESYERSDSQQIANENLQILLSVHTFDFIKKNVSIRHVFNSKNQPAKQHIISIMKRLLLKEMTFVEEENQNFDQIQKVQSYNVLCSIKDPLQLRITLSAFQSTRKGFIQFIDQKSLKFNLQKLSEKDQKNQIMLKKTIDNILYQAKQLSLGNIEIKQDLTQKLKEKSSRIQKKIKDHVKNVKFEFDEKQKIKQKLKNLHSNQDEIKKKLKCMNLLEQALAFWYKNSKKQDKVYSKEDCEKALSIIKNNFQYLKKNMSDISQQKQQIHEKMVEYELQQCLNINNGNRRSFELALIQGLLQILNSSELN